MMSVPDHKASPIDHTAENRQEAAFTVQVGVSRRFPDASHVFVVLAAS
jgi:hypothetical protein